VRSANSGSVSMSVISRGECGPVVKNRHNDRDVILLHDASMSGLKRD
jgi:hypothetical protein